LKNDEHSFLKKLGLSLRGFLAVFRKYPNFIIAGVQKGGTTSLFSYLDQHPSLKLSRPKEVHFFDDDYSRGMRFYKRYFPLKWHKVQTGEASPYYIFHPLVAARIKENLPNAKIIIVLRNPILRAYSHFHMQKRTGKEPLESFEAAIEAEAERLQGEEIKMIANPNYNSVNHKRFSYAARGMYFGQVKRWLRIFGKENILFIKSENLLENPEKELSKVYTFLGLKEEYPKSLQKKHVHSYPEIAEDTFNFLKSKYLGDQEKLKKLIGDEFSWF